MLTSLEIENFKGIGARQRIDFAALTLLFGANSAGKSTVLHALLYLHEVVERGLADVDRTELGGNVVELGGFARLVHRHDLDRSIVLRAELDTTTEFDRFGRQLRGALQDLHDEIDRVWIELRIGQKELRIWPDKSLPAVVPRVLTVRFGVNGVEAPLVELFRGSDILDESYATDIGASVNMEHPLLVGYGDELREAWEPAALMVGTRVLEVIEDGQSLHTGRPLSDEEVQRLADEGYGMKDGHILTFGLASAASGALPLISDALEVVSYDGEAVVVEQVRGFLEMIISGTTTQLAVALREALYVGPLRAIPTREFLQWQPTRQSAWVNGLRAWERLLGDRGPLVDQVNTWLDLLGAGCNVIVKPYYDRPDNPDVVPDVIWRLLIEGTGSSLVLPSEVGAGISQIVPVIVAALETRAGIALIEQPELHIHPKLQTKLGDLFIVASARRQFLIETHSEHLILRILRRIRETSEGELKEGAPAFAPDKLSVIYVEATPAGTLFRHLRVDERGEFKDRWPQGFFAERMEELL